MLNQQLIQSPVFRGIDADEMENLLQKYNIVLENIKKVIWLPFAKTDAKTL